MHEDPDEKWNVADVRADVKDALAVELMAWLDRQYLRSGEARVQTLDSETREKLRSLGYIE